MKLPVFPRLSSNKFVRYVNMLEGFTKILMRDPAYSHIFKNPLKKVRGTESYAEATRKIEEPRLIGMVQGFEISRQYCKH